MDNPKPLFHLKAKPREIKQIGHLKNHLKFQFTDEKSMVEGIGFGTGDLFHFIYANAEISIVGEFGMNEWNRAKTPQIVIKEMAINEWHLFDHRGKENKDILPYIKNY